MRHLFYALERRRRRFKAWLDRARGYPDLKRRYRRAFFSDPDLEAPKGFSEKIQWRKLNDRNPLFPVLADKLRCRDFVADRLGKDRAAELLPRLTWSGEAARDIPFEQLRAGAALKANHGSSWNLFLRPGEELDRQMIRRTCDRWLNSVFGVDLHEWAYAPIQPRLLAEELLHGSDGRTIMDLKVYVFDGKVALFHLRDNDSGARGLFLPDWSRAPATIHLSHNETDNDIGQPSRPPFLDDLVSVAGTLCTGFDMIRMDFLLSDTRFWIGEMTLYPASGAGFFAPETFEMEMGAKWRLPASSGVSGRPRH